MAYEFVDAVDGQELTDDELKTYRTVAYPPWPSLNARHLARGEIGCILSHLKIYNRMVKENIECACIFEDDCIFEENTGALLKNLQAVESDYELLLLGHSGLYQDPSRGAEHSNDRKKNVFSRYYIAKPIECPLGTYAYLIKQSAARTLLQYCYPLRIPMDLMTGHAEAIGVKVRILTPPIVRHDRALFPSTIYDFVQVKSLFLYNIRGIKMFFGDKFPLLRKLQRMCKLPCLELCLKLRKKRLFDEDSYIEERYFKKSHPSIHKTYMDGKF